MSGLATILAAKRKQAAQQVSPQGPASTLLGGLLAAIADPAAAAQQVAELQETLAQVEVRLGELAIVEQDTADRVAQSRAVAAKQATREKELTAWSAELDDRAAAVDTQLQSLGARRAEHEARVLAHQQAVAAAEAALAAKEADIAARSEEIDRRNMAVQVREAACVADEQALDAREEVLAAREAEHEQRVAAIRQAIGS